MPVPDVHRLGAAHQAAHAARGTRRAVGAWYTPADVVEHLLDRTLDPILAARMADGAEAVSALRVLDPACGAGAFLVAAARRIAHALERCGTAPAAARAAALRCTVGIDIDPEATDLCRAALVGDDRPDRTGGPGGTGPCVVTGDALLMVERADGRAPEAGARWADLVGPGGAAPRGFDLVIGNPPFLAAVRSRTAGGAGRRAELAARFGSAVSALTDTASLFFLLAVRAAAPGGTVCLIEPLSFLAARDSDGVRADVLALGSLVGLWDAQAPVFDADVAVCAPVLIRDAAPGPVALWTGRAMDTVGQAPAPEPAGAPWSPLLAAARGIPAPALTTAGAVGDVAVCAGDFRDQYYGLVGAVVDEEPSGAGEAAGPRLVTSGTIDPGRLLWGRRPTRFARTSFQRPRVVLGRLDGPTGAWAARRLVPKVLVAGQTRVLEAVADAEGALLPSVPVITVAAPADRVDHLGALLVSPPVTALAALRHIGAGLGSDALRLRAADVAALPLPGLDGPWDEAAAAFRAAQETDDPAVGRTHLLASAAAMCAAYGIARPASLLAWWQERLPPLRG